MTLESLPTLERLRHARGDYDLGGDARSRQVVTMRDAPLERALARKAIGEKQYAAGVKYRLHWYHAGLSDALQSVDPNRIFASDPSNFSGMAKTEKQYFHRERYRIAVQHVGQVNASVLEDVVCREISLEDAGRKLGWDNTPQACAAAMERVRTALDQLRELWGI